MRVLLAIDGSASSEAATQAVLSQFLPSSTEVRVLHVDDWPRDLPSSLDRLVLGSVSDGVARHAPCSVEIVRAPSAEHVS
jgi:Universal stress protein family